MKKLCLTKLNDFFAAIAAKAEQLAQTNETLDHGRLRGLRTL